MSDAHTLSVELGDRSYPIVIGQGLLDGGIDMSAYVAGTDVLIVTNETVAAIYAEKAASLFRGYSAGTVVLPDGEKYKSLETVRTIIDQLATSGANRDTTIVALGGGVVGDMAGFAAACYMRGVSFIQIPTTLLAQVDSSVGGKTGVNHERGKNLIGAFHQPRLVLVDTDTLNTLPDRELSAGLAEVIKHAAIADVGYLAALEQDMDALLDRDPAALVRAIRRSCEIKAAIVSEDERESGKRALLNFGHTFGHAIENCLGYGEWLHGEAVAAGMLMAMELGGLDAVQQDRLRVLIARAKLPVEPPAVGSAKLREAMNLDKKVANKSLRFVLLKALGEAFVTSEYSEDQLSAVLQAADG